MAKILGYVVRFEGVERLACLSCAHKRIIDPASNRGIFLTPIYASADHPGEFCGYCDALVLRKK